jgi:hypothetical protein
MGYGLPASRIEICSLITALEPSNELNSVSLDSYKSTVLKNGAVAIPRMQLHVVSDFSICKASSYFINWRCFGSTAENLALLNGSASSDFLHNSWIG